MSGRPLHAIAAVLAATVLVVLDASIVNVALPTLARALDVTPGASVLVVTAYQLALVTALLPCAALGESLGFRKVFIAGVSVFTAASALCALSPSLPWLVAARFVQGLGGAAVMSLGVALLRQVVPDKSLGAAIGWNATAVALASAAGPSIGALILSEWGWPCLFAVNLPVGAAVLLAGRGLPRRQGTRRRLDLVSAALNATVFAGLVAGADLLLTQAGVSIVLFAAAALALLLLLRREGPKAAPLVPLDLLRGASFRISVITSVCCFVGQAAALLALPFLLHHDLGQTTLMTGLYMTPWPLTVAVTAQAAGWLSDRVPTAWLCGLGGVVMALGLAGAAASPATLGPVALAPFVVVCGLGFGLFQTPNNRSMFLIAPPERSGAAGGLQGTARLTGQIAGAVLMTLIFTTFPLAAAPRVGLGIAAAFALAGGLISLLRSTSPPRPLGPTRKNGFASR
ncbi:MFS transporter [Phenylobacterium sp. LH3H17]|uniref:MFS transporter n=1 Tax=Phenylobacterium sp. LH3H17 TaxID=2903901 RepID=UPI0020C95279|nr:MFS transporter [Phenylobacterium sp. LH3H17]UTP40940.1 MFS transporter [Phenylobacterium sp. LH3H17]